MIPFQQPMLRGLSCSETIFTNARGLYGIPWNMIIQRELSASCNSLGKNSSSVLMYASLAIRDSEVDSQSTLGLRLLWSSQDEVGT